MIELSWWVLLLAGVGLFFCGQAAGVIGLLKVAARFDAERTKQHKVKLAQRYPGDGGPKVH